MPTLYVIPNWDRDFENSKSRQIERTTFFCVQNHFDGKKIRRLQNLKPALEFYGAFHAIAAIASKCWYRGVLLDLYDGPISALDLAAKTGFNVKKLGDAITELSKPGIGLIEAHEITFEEGKWQLPESVKRWAVPQDLRRRWKGHGGSPRAAADDGGPPGPRESAIGLPGIAASGGSPRAAADDGGPPGPRESAKVAEGKGTEGKGRELPLPSPKGGQGEEELSLDQALEFLDEVFGRKKRNWSYEERELLVGVLKAGAVPLAEWQLIRQWFKLPDDHPVFERTKRKQELVTFLRDFNGELDKIRRHREYFAPLNGANGAKKEPPGWRQTLRWLRGDQIILPERFDLLPLDFRKEYETNYENFKGSRTLEEEGATR